MKSLSLREPSVKFKKKKSKQRCMEKVLTKRESKLGNSRRNLNDKGPKVRN